MHIETPFDPPSSPKRDPQTMATTIDGFDLARFRAASRDDLNSASILWVAGHPYVFDAALPRKSHWLA